MLKRSRIAAWSRVRTLVAEKLGVCPFCMRTSAWGSALSWCLAAVCRFTFDSAPLTLLVAIVASAFSLLFLAHLVTYAFRSGIAARRYPNVVPRSDGFEISDPSRRDFLLLMAKATVYALAISFLGTMPGRAQLNACAGSSPPPDGDSTINNSTFGTAAEAQAYLDDQLLKLCDRACQVRPCPDDPQNTGKRCVQNDKKKPLGPKVIPIGNPPTGYRVGGKVKQCTCSCEGCAGDHRIPDTSTGQKGEGDPTTGSAEKPTEAEAIAAANEDAKTKCKQLCERFKNCTNPTPKCLYAGQTNGEGKSWKDAHGTWHATLKVKICRCSCQAP
jgi:hypothetical protein